MAAAKKKPDYWVPEPPPAYDPTTIAKPSPTELDIIDLDARLARVEELLQAHANRINTHQLRIVCLELDAVQRHLSPAPLTGTA